MKKIRTRSRDSKWKRAVDRAIRIAIGTLAAGVLGIAGYDLYQFLFRSGSFVVHKIEVQGCHRTSPATFTRLAQAADDCNILCFRTGQLAERLRLHPWVEEVRVTRMLPETLRIVLKEREPLAAVNSPFDGQVYGLDRNLIILPEPESEQPASATASLIFNLPIITGLPSEEIYPGNRLNDPRARRVVDAILMLRALNAPFLQQLSEIHVDADQALVLYPLHRVTTVYLGGEKLESRMWRLCKVWDYLEAHEIECQFVDCRFDAQGVVTRPENLTLAKWNALPENDRNLLFGQALENEG